jgi:RNA polymerase sigma-70 factor, ECF subfamily
MPCGPGADPETEESGLDRLSDEELVDQFLATSAADRPTAHRCFEAILTRYQWLINHIVRSSHFRFPAWDSADDVIARVVFKVYRGLGQWRREGKLSSFIARIASSEMIDTFRRVGRDKSYNPHQSPADPDSDEPAAVDRAISREPSPEMELVDRERHELVEQLLADVCRDWKDGVIVNEYIIGNRGAKEISDKYHLSEDLVYQRARRLKVRLVKWLHEHGITTADQLFGRVPSAKRA